MIANGFLTTVSTTATSTGDVFENSQRPGPVTLADSTDPAEALSQQRAASIPVGAESPVEVFTTATWKPDQGSDWRIRLSIPPIASFEQSPILDPLKFSGNSMVWPLTPQVMLNHSATYNNMTPTHSNYPFHVYQSSQVEDITITGDFPVENENDGRYWIAAVHFMRSMTKMFYGESSNRGLPPPISKLNGYGGFIFKNLPVVIKLFTVDLPNGVDYIKVPILNAESIDLTTGQTTINSTGEYVYVPTLSTISATLAIAPSRDDVRRFSLDRFVKGDYISEGKFI